MAVLFALYGGATPTTARVILMDQVLGSKEPKTARSNDLGPYALGNPPVPSL